MLKFREIRQKRLPEVVLFLYSVGQSRSQDADSPWRPQSAPQESGVCQGKGCEQAGGVLRKPPVAHLGKAPEPLDHMQGVLAAGAGLGAQAIDRLLVTGKWPGPIDSA